MTLLGVVLLAVGGLVAWRCSRGGGPYRAGPWPGLTARGAGVLLGCALLLGGDQLILGSPRRPLPDLPILALAACAPIALAIRLSRIPGAAAAVCGAYLLPRSVASLIDPLLEPPPLLLVPALVVDLSLWLRPGDLANLVSAWPGRRASWRKRDRSARQPGLFRAAVAGGLFGLMVAAVEVPFAVLLGADAATWSGADVNAAAAASAAVCAVVGLSVPGTGW